jgi:uncharacterized membrane protein
MKWIKVYFVTLIVFFVIDIIWLGLIAKNMYKQELGYIMSDKPNWLAALVFYLIFIFGLTYFVIYPGLESGRLIMTVVNGMILGFVAYATYDLTNLATLEGWPFRITVIDLIWGTSLGGLVSLISYIINSKLLH